jgi:hypothetical protein
MISYSPYSRTDLARKSRHFGHDFRGDFRIFVVVYGPYGTVRTADCGHGKRGTEEVVQQYGFGTENEADLCGTDLVL